MNTLIIYSGGARSFKQVWANHAFWFWRRCKNPTFVVSVSDDEQAEDMRLIQHAYPDAPFFFEKVVQPPIPEPPCPILCDWHNVNLTNATPQAILRQFWALERAWTFAKESTKGATFDVVVRIRPDIAFFRLGKVPMPEVNECLTPWFCRFGGVNDRFAVMHPSVADTYFGTFSARQSLWDEYCPLHSETMLGFQLSKSGVTTPHSIEGEFGIVRMTGECLHINPQHSDILDFCRLPRYT